MKIFGLNVPPALLALYESLLTRQSGVDLSQQIRRAAKLKTRVLGSRSANATARDITSSALYIAAMRGFVPKTPQYDAFVIEEADRLRNRIFDPRWWYACKLLHSIMHASSASSTVDPTPKPYKYQRPDMLQSDVLYSDGEATLEDSGSDGQVVDGVWRDGVWRWRLDTFNLLWQYPSKEREPLIWWGAGTVSASSTIRGSRPMWSLLLKGLLGDLASPEESDLSPPYRPASSLYWRYLMPLAGSGPYAESTARPFVLPLQRRIPKSATGLHTRLFLKYGARPMLGHGFNNNNNVHTDWVTESSRLFRPFGAIPEGAYTRNIAVPGQDSYVMPEQVVAGGGSLAISNGSAARTVYFVEHNGSQVQLTDYSGSSFVDLLGGAFTLCTYAYTEGQFWLEPGVFGFFDESIAWYKPADKNVVLSLRTNHFSIVRSSGKFIKLLSYTVTYFYRNGARTSFDMPSDNNDLRQTSNYLQYLTA